MTNKILGILSPEVKQIVKRLHYIFKLGSNKTIIIVMYVLVVWDRRFVSDAWPIGVNWCLLLLQMFNNVVWLSYGFQIARQHI